MNWSHLWAWPWSLAKKASARRHSRSARLAVETLEDRVVPSAATDYEIWRQQIYQVDDAAVTVADPGPQAQSNIPQNLSFGSLIGLPSAFSNTSYRGAGYSVAVIDTGIDYRNADLGGGFGAGYRVIAGWDFANNDANPLDDNGHGTHVAGIIGSSSATYSGVAPDVNFIALKVLDANGSGSFAAVEDALQWVVANRAQYNIVAVNMSLGAGNYTTNPYTFLSDEFNALRGNGVFISVAAGNSFYTYNSQVGLDYPAVDPLVVSVGAVYAGNFGSVAWGSGARDFTTAADRVASFSQRGPGLSIVAPGAMITSSYLNNTTRALAGTSMAAPVIAGSAVLLHQALDAQHRTANQDTILSLMKSTGANVVDGDDENDNVTNTGLSFKRIDIGAALASLGQPSNSAPVLQAVGNQLIAPGATLTLALNATDPDQDSLTFSARVLNGSDSQAYALRQEYGLQYAGDYYTNTWGSNEKWLSGSGDAWYCILPNGELRRWTGSMATTLEPANLIATLDTSFYTDPSLLWNAQPGAADAPSLSLNGNQLTIQAPAGAAGSYQIEVSVTDGVLTSTQTFTVSVQNNTAPQISTIANQSMFTNRSRTITLAAFDAQNNPITYSVAFVGNYSVIPASLRIQGNKLTIYTSPDFVGRFDLRVTASDGALSTSTIFQVNAAVDIGVKRLNGDFNGDGIQDTAFFNSNGAWWFSLKNSDGTFSNHNWCNWSAAKYWSRVFTGDFNGDGRTDIAGFSTTGSWWIGYSTGTGINTTLRAAWAAASAWKFIQVGDFNGDGKTDLLGFSTAGNLRVGASTGDAFTTNLWTHWSVASNWIAFKVADVDGDGLLDFAGRNANGNWYVAYSTGINFKTRLWGAATPPGNQG